MSNQYPHLPADNLRRWEESGQPRTWVETRGGQWGHGDWLLLLRTLQQSEFWPLDPGVAGELLDHLKVRYHNLRRWVESGWPRRWVAGLKGRWGNDDWLNLLGALRGSSFWPLEPEAVGRALEEVRRRHFNLRRWERSGQARAWVDARGGRWDHGDWLDLLDGLRRSEFWPLDSEAVAEILGELQEEWRNLRRWQQSGQARGWVEARQGRWGQEDWQDLLERLGRSEFWPLDPAAAERIVKRVAAEWWNLQRWQDSGQPWLWVNARRGQWGEEEWLALLDNLRRSAYWPLDPEAVARVVERVKCEYGNLRRWQESGAPQRWVEARLGRWGREDWRVLLQSLQQSEFWPLDPTAAEAALETIQTECINLRRWERSGQARLWVEEREAQWDHRDWVALLDGLRRSEFWPLEVEAVGRLLGELKLQWWNLRRWRASGLARQWVEAHQGRWGEPEWPALVEEMRRTGFWPVDATALARVLEEVRVEWTNLRRWEQSGQPRRWLEGHGGRGAPEDWGELLNALKGSAFWPLDLQGVRQVLERLRPSAGRAA